MVVVVLVVVVLVVVMFLVVVLAVVLDVLWRWRRLRHRLEVTAVRTPFCLWRGEAGSEAGAGAGGVRVVVAAAFASSF